MLDYALEQLGPDGFQQLAASLLVRTCGPGLVPMGQGRDGGRDLWTEDPVSWGQTEDTNSQSTGYSVFQVKSKRLPDPSNDLAWLWKEIRTELDEWTNPYSDRKRAPDNLIFVTNVRLSAFPSVGGRDALKTQQNAYHQRLVADLDTTDDRARDFARTRLNAFRKIRNIRVLDRAWVVTQLHAHEGVRRAFPALLTTTDAFAYVSELLARPTSESLGDSLKEHARDMLISDGMVWLADTGQESEERVPLASVFTDLPVLKGPASSRERTTALEVLLSDSEKVRKRSVAVGSVPRHLVLTGAPGNGKTTLSKFIAQVFRSRLLDAQLLSETHLTVRAATLKTLSSLGQDDPRHLRWPIRIDLAELLQSGALVDEGGMLRAIATSISMHTNSGAVSPSVLSSWLRTWPALLILDGFDEVTDPTARRMVIAATESFAAQIAALDADVFIILTTRALGYRDEIDHNLFDRVDLDYLDNAEALAYAAKVGQARYGADRPRKERVRLLVEQVANDSARRSLLRTPLQIMILTMILDASQRVDPERFLLFSTYFDVAFKREMRKGAALAQTLDELKPVIILLHQYAGFDLHMRSESGLELDPVLSEVDFRELIRVSLSDEGYNLAARNAELEQQVFRIATERLVLITPQPGGFGFEVRSLQEFTAALWLLKDSDKVSVRRIGIALANPHWRNVILFASGALLEERTRAAHAALVARIQTIDSDEEWILRDSLPLAPQFALDLLDEGIARNRPLWRAAIYSVALRAIDYADVDFVSAAEKLVSIAAHHTEERDALIAKLRVADTTSWTSRVNAETIRNIANPRRRGTDGSATGGISATPISSRLPPPRRGLELLDEVVLTSNLEGQELEALHDAVEEIRETLVHRYSHDFDPKPVLKALTIGTVASEIAYILALYRDDSRLMGEVQREVWPELARRSVSDRIQSATDVISDDE